MFDLFNKYKCLLENGILDGDCVFCNEKCDSFVVRGATKDHSFKLPCEIDIIKKLRLTYAQNGKVVLEKSLNDLQVTNYDNSLVYFTITEKESLKFDAKFDIQVQLKILVDYDRVITSEIFTIDVVDSLDDRPFSFDDNEVVIDVFIDSLKIKSVSLEDLYPNTKNMYKVKFHFDSTWDTLGRREAVFRDSYYHEERIILHSDNECYIPQTVLEKPGDLHIGAIGYLMANSPDEEIEKPTEWSEAITVHVGCKEKENDNE